MYIYILLLVTVDYQNSQMSPSGNSGLPKFSNFKAGAFSESYKLEKFRYRDVCYIHHSTIYTTILYFQRRTST